MKKTLLLATALFFGTLAFCQNSRETIAVFPPILERSVSYEDAAWLSDVVQGKLANAFFSYSTLIPLDQGAILLAMNEIKKSQNSIGYDEGTMLKAGKRVGAKYYAYVKINYLERGANYNMTFYILDISTSSTLGTFDDTCTREQLRKKEGNIIYKAVYEMLSHKRMNSGKFKDGQFKHEAHWAELEKFIGVADAKKK